jgi:hypothetical protein
VNYIIASDTFERDRRILEPFVAAYRGRLEEVYHNTEFHLYKVNEAGDGQAGGHRGSGA